MNRNLTTNTEKIKFICLPSGGTSSVVFYKCFGRLSEKYRPSFIDLPGCGIRKAEAPLTNIDALFWNDTLTKYHISIWNSVPLIFEMLLTVIEANNLPLPLRAVMLSGDWISSELYSNCLKSRLPPYMVPTVIHFANHVPLTSNGKVDRKESKSCGVKI